MIVYCDNRECPFLEETGKRIFEKCMASDVTISPSDGEIECPGGQFQNVHDTNVGSMTSIEQLSNLLTVAQDEGEITPEEFEKFHDLLDRVPSVEQENKRDIPMPPSETIDTTWGIECKRPVCPNCDYYLPMVHFFPLNKDASGNAKRITYCEHCGQAIDWRGFNYE